MTRTFVVAILVLVLGVTAFGQAEPFGRLKGPVAKVGSGVIKLKRSLVNL